MMSNLLLLLFSMNFVSSIEQYILFVCKQTVDFQSKCGFHCFAGDEAHIMDCSNFINQNTPVKHSEWN